jgi:peptidoglycan L-alanyl-D-glutamate endopeptidase CwlK
MGRNLNELRPVVKIMAEGALHDCEQAGLKVLVTCTGRTSAEQAALYAQGRTTPGKKVTNAKPGQSFHEYGVALDLYPLVNGKPDFSGTAPEWNEIAAIFKKHGFEWAFEWRKFKEKPHFQYTGGHPLSWFQQGGRL